MADEGMSHTKQRAGRPSYNLAGGGHLVPFQKVAEEIHRDQNGNGTIAQVVYNGWKCSYCDWVHFLKNGGINTTRALDHLLLKCTGIPDHKRLSLYNGESQGGRHIKRRIPSEAVEAHLTGHVTAGAEEVTLPATKRPRGRPKGSTSRAQKATQAEAPDPTLSSRPVSLPASPVASQQPSQKQRATNDLSVCAFLVASGLPFSTIQSPAFSQMASVLCGSSTPHLPAALWLAGPGMGQLETDTRTKVEKRFSTIGLGSALTLKVRMLTAAELQVLQFCEQQGRRFAYRDTVPKGEVPRQIQQQLEGRAAERWCGLVLDDNEALEATQALLEASHKTILCYSCASRALDSLLSTCLNMAQETVSGAWLVAGLVVDHPAVSAMLSEAADGPADIKCMPLGRSMAAAEMLQSLLASKGAFEATLGQGKWQDSTPAPEDPNLPRVMELIGSQGFWADLTSSNALLSPVCAAAKAMAADGARISSVYYLFHALEKDISSWAAMAGGLGSLALDAFTDIWTGGRRLYQPVHLAAYLLDPYLAYDCDLMPPGGPRIVRSVLRVYCSSELGTNELMEAFYAFHSRSEALDEAVDEAQSHVTTKLEALKAQAGPGPALTFTQAAALRCQAAGDPIAWWKIHGGVYPGLRDAAIRVLSCCPVACAPQGLPMLEEAVGSAGAAALGSPELKRLLYCQANQRALGEGLTVAAGASAEPPVPSLVEEVLAAAAHQ